MTHFGHDIGQCLLMACLGNIGSLKSTLSQTETILKSKLHENE